MTIILLCQPWLESERGWGTRPDGYTLHASEADLAAFIAAHFAHDRLKYGNRTPECYSAPDGDPYWIPVSKKLAAKLAASEQDGIWGRGPTPTPPNPALSATL